MSLLDPMQSGLPITLLWLGLSICAFLLIIKGGK